MMNHIVKQMNGEDDYMCAQYSLAMTTGKSVSEVVKAVGHRRGTSIKQIRQAAERLGFELADDYENHALEGRGIIIIHDESETLGHAMAWEDGTVYDPDGGTIAGLQAVILRARAVDFGVTHMLRVEPVKAREWLVGKRKEGAQ